jgi:hypothetical protein
MVKGTGRVDSGFTGHDGCVSLYPIKINLSPSSPIFSSAPAILNGRHLPLGDQCAHVSGLQLS